MSIFNRFFGVEIAKPVNDEHKFHFSKFTQGLVQKLFSKSRIEQINSIDDNLKKDIENLKEHCLNFNKKIKLVNVFLKQKNFGSIDKIEEELKTIKKITKKEFNEDKNEDKFTIEAINTINKVISKEKFEDYEDNEIEIRKGLMELKKDIELLEKCLQKQLDFFKRPLNFQIKTVKELLYEVNNEARIIGLETKIIDQIKKEIDEFEIETIMFSQK
jgi:hypothetical protein